MKMNERENREAHRQFLLSIEEGGDFDIDPLTGKYREPKPFNPIEIDWGLEEASEGGRYFSNGDHI
jgi:hypothetical protein